MTSPEHVVLVAASLDDPSGFRSEMDIWVSTAQPWDYLHPDIPKFETQLVQKRLTQEELAELLASRG